MKQSFHPNAAGYQSLGEGRAPTTTEVTTQFTAKLLGTVTSAKYLGVTLQIDVGWEGHIGCICTKADRMLGFQRRNLKVASTTIKELSYKAVVRPFIEHASTVWNPHSSKHTASIEKIQRKAAHLALK